MYRTQVRTIISEKKYTFDPSISLSYEKTLNICEYSCFTLLDNHETICLCNLYDLNV